MELSAWFPLTPGDPPLSNGAPTAIVFASPLIAIEVPVWPWLPPPHPK